MKILKLILVFCCFSVSTWAQSQSTASTSENERESPWLIVPLLSANPKLDTAAGAMVGYIHQFDPKSRTSMFGLQAKYSTSDSIVGGIMGRASFGEDHHRINAGVAFGQINNEYKNYLESGQSVDTQDRLRSTFVRYLYRIHGNIFLGAQGAFTNYELAGKNVADDEILTGRSEFPEWIDLFFRCHVSVLL